MTTACAENTDEEQDYEEDYEEDGGMQSGLARGDDFAKVRRTNMIVGQKVVCVDDKFPPEVAQFYQSLPKKDQIYVIREVKIGVNWKAEPGEVCIYLIGLVNPRSDKPPFPERGFNAERFRPLEEIKQKVAAEKSDYVEA